MPPRARFALDLAVVAAFVAAGFGAEPATAAAPGPESALAPCDLFTAELAGILQPGPFKPGAPHVAGPVAICWRHSDDSYPGAQGVSARFERMSRESFVDGACRSPISKVQKVSGIGEAACAFRLGVGGLVSLAVLTRSGWVVQVGNSTMENCKAVVAKLIPKLPQ